MKDKKDLFDISPPDSHIAKVKNAAEDILSQRRQEERRKILSWILVPAFASALGIIFWKKSGKPDESLFADQDVMIEFDNANDVELVADLEILEDLETLEDWDGIEEA